MASEYWLKINNFVSIKITLQHSCIVVFTNTLNFLVISLNSFPANFDQHPGKSLGRNLEII